MNKVILLGHLGDDPSVKQFDNGNSVANFSLATSESYKDKNTGEWQNKTEWHKVSVFGNTVNYVSKYLAKGSKVLIEGKIQTRSWEQDGVTKYITEIVVPPYGGSIKGLDKAPESNGQQQQAPQQQQQRQQQPTQAAATLAAIDEEDLPF